MNWNYCFLDQITEEQYNNIYNSLSPSRLAHISRFKKEEDMRRSLAGEFLIKRILTEDFGIETPLISRNEKGQPIIENTDIFISISHSGDLAVAAADRKPIGIDAEKIKPRNLKLAEKICLPEEKEYIFSFFSFGLVAVIQKWIENDCVDDIYKIADIMKKVIGYNNESKTNDK